jgi:23S rRNA (adenine2503-C2)-methyltransferase
MTGTKQNLFGLTQDELEEAFAELGLERYRAEQAVYWLYNRVVSSFDEMTNLRKDLRAVLNERYAIRRPVISRISESSDGTKKYLLQTEDGLYFESVLIPSEHAGDAGESKRLTLCLSTQVGCPLDCRFCATGSMKLERNLSPGEIAGQYLEVQASLTDRITNLVYMGMGEPLLNYDSVMKSVEIITHEKTCGVGANRITISTAGIIPAIKRMADERRKVKLAVSLHSCDDETRRALMPITKTYPLSELLDSAEYYYKQTRKRITYEYILFDGVNDTPEDLKRLVKVARRVPGKVNIIPFHSIETAYPEGIPLGLKPSTPGRVEAFASGLREANVTVMFRTSSGKDIDAACGQLAVRYSAG